MYRKKVILVACLSILVAATGVSIFGLARYRTPSENAVTPTDTEAVRTEHPSQCASLESTDLNIETLLHVGTDIHYENIDIPEALASGPAGIFAYRDGYSVLDSVDNSVLVLDRALQQVKRIAIGDTLRGAISLAEYQGDMYVLGTAETLPVLMRITSDGTRTYWRAPLGSSFVTGMLADDLGLLIEEEDGSGYSRVTFSNASVSLAKTDQLTFGGVSYHFEKTDAAFPQEQTLNVGATSVVLKGRNALSTKIIGQHPKGGVVVMGTDFDVTGKEGMRRILWHVDVSGDVVAMYEVPLREQLLVVAHPAAVGCPGIMTLNTTHDGVQIFRPRKE